MKTKPFKKLHTAAGETTENHSYGKEKKAKAKKGSKAKIYSSSPGKEKKGYIVNSLMIFNVMRKYKCSVSLSHSLLFGDNCWFEKNPYWRWKTCYKSSDLQMYQLSHAARNGSISITTSVPHPKTSSKPSVRNKGVRCVGARAEKLKESPKINNQSPRLSAGKHTPTKSKFMTVSAL